MKLLLFGKTRGANHLVEDAATDLRASGHDVLLFSYRNNKLKKLLEPLLLSPSLRVPLAVQLTRAVRRFAPDLVIAFGPYHWLPPPLFEYLAAMPGRPPMVAWIGDRFAADAAAAANLFDIAAYTDTGFQDLHRQFGFRCTSLFLPPAAAWVSSAASARAVSRQDRLAFVASATDHRRHLLAQLTQPVVLFGSDWRDAPELAQHPTSPRRIGATELAAIYRSHLGALNIRHEQNVINGLNQRHFGPYVEAAPVISDPQPDIVHCFEPGREILLYRDAGELNELIVALRREPDRARQVGEAGRRRVRDSHTYASRIATLAQAAGIRRPAAMAGRGAA